MPERTDHLRIVRLLTRQRLLLQGYALAITGDHQTAEDVFQEVAALVTARPKDVPEGDGAAPWLREVTRRKALELRRKSRRGGLLLAQETLDLIEGDFADEPVGAHAHAVLARCIEQLDEGHRRILEGRYRENLSAQEIAAAASRSVQAVYAVLKRVRRALLACMRTNLRSIDGHGDGIGEGLGEVTT